MFNYNRMAGCLFYLYRTVWKTLGGNSYCSRNCFFRNRFNCHSFYTKNLYDQQWGSGSEISLHLPATATSTLHTDTIDYVRGTDICS